MPAIWCIYHIENCPHTKPTPKDKFVAIVCRDLTPMGFFINTNISRYVQKRPVLRACQVYIKALDYNFLNYNSYIDCSKLLPFEDAHLVGGRWSITTKTKSEIKRAVTNSRTIERRYKKLILGK